MFVFRLRIVETVRGFVPHVEQERAIFVALVQPLDRHLGDDVRVVPLHYAAFATIEAESIIKVLALPLVRDEVIESRSFVVIVSPM